MYEKKKFFKETLCIAVSVYVSEKNSSMSGMVEKKNYNKLLQAYPMHKKTKLHSFHSHCYFFKKKEI